MGTERRHTQWSAVEQTTFDVVIIGGGINGACIYHHLCRLGLSVLLVDKGDFAAGTSQASAMMVWGGILYLRHWDVFTVRRLCRSRDGMLREMSDWVKPRQFRYIPPSPTRARFVHAALHFYWMLGGCRRRKPTSVHEFPERELLAKDRRIQSICYEEAMVGPSDARFVLHWLLPYQNGIQHALNYCGLEHAAFDQKSRQWHLELSDSLIHKQRMVRAKCVVNAAGVWTDEINQSSGVTTPFQHVLSKGVFIALNRDARHEVPLLFDTGDKGDYMSLTPWGPVSLWGPTETLVDSVRNGYTVQTEDVRYLLNELNRHLVNKVGPEDVVSLRCGIRPLAVHRSHGGNGTSLSLSRRHHIHRDAHLPWISIYGGKLTNCVRLASNVSRLVGKMIAPKRAPHNVAKRQIPDPPRITFPHLNEPIPSAHWCSDWEMCWKLEDYLRRRTNVAQWIARGGLGRNDEYIPFIARLSKNFVVDDNDDADRIVARYRHNIVNTFDQILSSC